MLIKMKKRLFPTFPNFSRLFETKLEMCMFLVFSLYHVNSSREENETLSTGFNSRRRLGDWERRFEEEKREEEGEEEGEKEKRHGVKWKHEDEYEFESRFRRSRIKCEARCRSAATCTPAPSSRARAPVQ